MAKQQNQYCWTDFGKQQEENVKNFNEAMSYATIGREELYEEITKEVDLVILPLIRKNKTIDVSRATLEAYRIEILRKKKELVAKFRAEKRQQEADAAEMSGKKANRRSRNRKKKSQETLDSNKSPDGV